MGCDYEKEQDYKYRIKKRWKKSMLFPTAVIVFIAFTIAYITIGEATVAITYNCVKDVTVVDILSVDYRSATILTEDNEEIVLNQKTFTIGDRVCVKTERTTDWSRI